MNEVEEAIQAEPGLSEDQQMWLRCAVYDCYDLLVMCDEFLNPVGASGCQWMVVAVGVRIGGEDRWKL